MYGPIHKAIRRLISDLIVSAGATDWNNADEVAQVQRSAPEMAAALDAMFPAISIYDQTATLGALKADAPAPVFAAQRAFLSVPQPQSVRRDSGEQCLDGRVASIQDMGV